MWRIPVLATHAFSVAGRHRYPRSIAVQFGITRRLRLRAGNPRIADRSVAGIAERRQCLEFGLAIADALQPGNPVRHGGTASEQYLCAEPGVEQKLVLRCGGPG